MFEFLFNHSREAFSKGEVVLAGTLPAWLLWAVCAGLALLCAIWLIRRRRDLAAHRLAAIWILQGAMLGILAVLAWQPALRIEELRTGDNIIALLLDISGSMDQKEPDVTRLESARALLHESELARALETRYAVRRFQFASDAEPVENYAVPPVAAGSTDLGKALLNVMRLSRNASLAAVVVASDGSDNSGRLDRDMLAEIAAFGVPVHAIGIGALTLPGDIELEDVELPERALPGTNVTASVAIRHDAPVKTRIKVYDGEEFLAAQELELSGDSAVTTTMIDFNAPEKGIHDLRFSLENLPDEANLRNNSRGRALEVADRTYRILYIEGEPRWEYKFLRRALEDDPGLDLVTLLRVSPNKFYRQGIENADELAEGFPTARAELFKFDALMIGSIEAPHFSKEQQELIRDFVSIRGGSLMMIAGPNGLGDGGWGNSAVSEVLPARLDVKAPAFVRERAKVSLTPIGGNTPMLHFSGDAEDNLKQWNELPEIADHQAMGDLRPAAVSLLQIHAAQGEQPLLVMQPYGRGRSYLLATGGTWRWQMGLPKEDQRHETFWRQLARGLVNDVPNRFELSARLVDERVTIQARLYDENYEPARDLAVTTVVTPPAGDPVTIELRSVPGQPGLLEAEYLPDASGLYQLEAIARRGEEPLESTTRALRFDQGDAENFRLRQDRTMLESIAAATGGRYWQADELGQLPDVIQHSGAGITERLLLPLWNAPAWFILLLFLKSAEWLLRRRWRTI